MYREKWFIYGVKKVKFVNENGETVEGYQVFYQRAFYDSEESEGWFFGGFCPKKPAWVSVPLGQQLLSVLQQGKPFVAACYIPAGRFNRLNGFEVFNDEENSDNPADLFDDITVD